MVHAKAWYVVFHSFWDAEVVISSKELSVNFLEKE